MEIKYDREADALYIELRKDKFCKNKKIDDSTIVDLDENNQIIGIEILGASKRIPSNSLSKIHVENIKVEESC